MEMVDGSFEPPPEDAENEPELAAPELEDISPGPTAVEEAAMAA